MSGHAVVLEILRQAVSQDVNVLKPAQQKLEAWETVPGFYVILKDVFCDHSIEENVRLIAVLYFKNGVDKYWRPNASNAISEDEKKSFRQSLPFVLKEPSKMIAVHLSVLIAKIARFDCPKYWPELIPDLLKSIQSNDFLAQIRALKVLHEIIKTLSSKRLSADRKMFQDLTAFLYSDIFNLWNTSVSEVFFSYQQNKLDSNSWLILSKTLLCLKILEKLTVRGFRNPSESELVDKFMKLVIERTKIMLQMKKDLNDKALDELATKYISNSINILQRFLEAHQESFINYILPVLEFTIVFTFTPAGEQYIYEQFIIQCFTLIRSIFTYNLANKEQNSRERQIKESFFSPDVLSAICRKLITHYFLITPNEIKMWEEDPESFAVVESGDAWKFNWRLSVEYLFNEFFNEFRTTFVPIVLDLLRQNEAIVPPEDVQAILIKDAIYNVVGMTAPELYDEVDFDNWLTTTLVKELSIQHENYKVLRKRIIWLIGCWTGIKISPDLFPLVYSTLINFLKPEEDMVIRLTSANTIKSVIDIFEFNIDKFLEYLEPTFYSLFNLLKEAKECDTKMRILHVLYFIIERVDHCIEPYYNNLVQYLPVLWEESEPHNMLRCAVVTTLVNLVKALGKLNHSVEVYNFILSIISLSTDVNEKCNVYLLEDGLELWQAVIENIPGPSNAILQLYKNMPALLENSSDTLRICISITSAYVLLAPNEFLQVYGERVVQALKDIMIDMRPEGLVVVGKLVELFLRANPSLSCVLVKPLLPKLFESICYETLSPQVFSVYLSILSRVLLESKEIFIEAAKEVSSSAPDSKDEIFNKFIDTWLEDMPYVVKPRQKKILALALASLLPTDPSFIYNKFCGILLAVSEVLNDIVTFEDNSIPFDSTLTSYELMENSETMTENSYRKKLVVSRDLVHTISLIDYLQLQLLQLKNSLSPLQFDQFVQTVDAETLAQVRLYVPL
ncbi:importin-11 [Cimex lectularius]|uniref:Importin N-terminal domain-containing protein n=1 Tax=Cimex lectularius TaxID=79782 RepID=A0A8I6RFW9_CIMLE|nr:importin-11 [Cimex lectularius]